MLVKIKLTGVGELSILKKKSPFLVLLIFLAAHLLPPQAVSETLL